MAATQQGQESALYTYDSFGGNRKKSENNFLCWCAGAHQPLLNAFPSEKNKYAGLGGVLLATFVLATLSAGYALYSIFGSWIWALGFALIWGLIIFNFDRFLVSTMRKYGIPKRKQWLMALPRLALAILIGITIARPLELKIFEKEINTRVEENLHHEVAKNDSLLNAENLALINRATAERNRLTDRKLAIEDSLHRLQTAYVQEADGTGGSGLRGIEDLTRLKMEAYQAARRQYAPELKSIESGISLQDSLLRDAGNRLEADRKTYAASIRQNVGFLERNKALSDLSDEEPSVYWTSLFLSLLIILIEIGPVLSKMIMPLGPYDIELAKEELTSMAASENEMRKDKELLTEKKKSFYQKQKEVSDQLVDQMTALQKKHIDQELEKWERGEWQSRDHRASMDEVLRKIKAQYQLREDDLL